MQAQRREALASYRSRVRAVLAAAYNCVPDESFAEHLASLDTSGRDWPSELLEGIRLIEGLSRACEGRPAKELATELAVERTRLFCGLKPGLGPPPPHQSVYVGFDGQPRMQATAAVARSYAEAGVGLPEGLKEQPDYNGISSRRIRS